MDTEQEQTTKKYQDVPKEKVLIYDVETTGLSYEDDEILQLSIIDGTGKVLFNELCYSCSIIVLDLNPSIYRRRKAF